MPLPTLVKRISPVAWDRAFAVLLSVALVLPCAVTERAPGPWHLGWPELFGQGTDEEAYLVMLNSAVRDLDLDLKNDHARVLAGEADAGAKARGRILDHHATYWIDGQRRVWRDLVDPDVRHWRATPDGLRVPVFRAGVDPALAAGPERPAHPPGLVFLLFPLLFPFRHSPEWIEHVALLCAAGATVIGLWLLRALLRRFTASAWTRNVTLTAAVLGTPVWFHARTLFTEPFLVPLILGAVLAALQPRRQWLAGLCVALAMTLKPNVLLVLPFLLLPSLQRREPEQTVPRRWRQLGKDAAWLGLAPFCAGLLLLWLNARHYGSPLHGPVDFAFGRPLFAAVNYLFARDRGLLWFAPAVLVGTIGFGRLWRSHRVETGTILGAAAALIGLMLVWHDWNGGWTFGPRLLLPAVPLLSVGLVGLLEAPWFAGAFLPRLVLYDALLYAVLMNGRAVFRYWITMRWTEAWRVFLDLLGTIGMR